MEEKKKLGEILVEDGLVPEDLIFQLVDEQKDATETGKPRKKLGEMLVDSGAITLDQLESSLKKQSGEEK